MGGDGDAGSTQEVPGSADWQQEVSSDEDEETRRQKDAERAQRFKAASKSITARLQAALEMSMRNEKEQKAKEKAKAQQAARAKQAEEQAAREEAEGDSTLEALEEQLGRVREQAETRLDASDLEPPCTDERVLIPFASGSSSWPPHAIPAAPAAIPELCTAAPDEALAELLRHQAAVAVLGTGQDVLRALFARMSNTGCGLAALELTDHYHSSATHDFSWVPSWQDFMTALRSAGYRGQGQGGQGKEAAGLPGGEVVVRGPEPAPGSLPSADGLAAWRELNAACGHVQSVLRVLCALLRHEAAAPGLLDFSAPAQPGATTLLLALLELQLVPLLRRLALAELQEAAHGLAEAWGIADLPAWRSAVAQVSGHVPALGPSHRAAMVVVRSMQGGGRHMRALQVASALALLAAVVDTQPDVEQPPPSQAMGLLGADAAATNPQTLLRRLQKRDGSNKPDYFRVLSAIECAFLVLWPLAYTDGDEAALRESAVFKAFINRLDSSGNLKRHPTGALIASACSEMSNQLEFGLGV